MRPLVEALVTKKNINNVISEDEYVIIPFGDDMKDMFNLNYEKYRLDYYNWNSFYISVHDLEKVYNKPAKDVIANFTSPYTKVWRTTLEKKDVEKLFNSIFEYTNVGDITKRLKKDKNFTEIR